MQFYNIKANMSIKMDLQRKKQIQDKDKDNSHLKMKTMCENPESGRKTVSEESISSTFEGSAPKLPPRGHLATYSQNGKSRGHSTYLYKRIIQTHQILLPSLNNHAVL